MVESRKSQISGSFLNRVSTELEAERFEAFRGAFATSTKLEDIQALWRKWRSPYRSVDTGFMLAGATSLDEDGFATSTALDEVINEARKADGDVLILKVGVTSGGQLNAAIGAENVNEILAEYRARVAGNLSDRLEGISLNDSNLKIISDGPSQLVAISLPSIGADFSQVLVGEVEWAVGTALEDGLHEFDLDKDISQPEIEPIPLTTNEMMRLVIRGIQSYPVNVLPSAHPSGTPVFEQMLNSLGVERDNLLVNLVKPFGHTFKQVSALVKKPKQNFAQARKQELIAEAISLGMDQFKAHHLFKQTGEFPLDDITGSLGRVNRADFLDYVKENKADTDVAVYIEQDIGNLGALNETIGFANANRVFAEISTLCRVRLEQVGLDATMIRHGGDEFSFVGAIAEGSVEQLHAAVDDLTSIIKDYVDNVPAFYDRSGNKILLREIIHPKEIKNQQKIMAKLGTQTLPADYQPIRGKGTSVTSVCVIVNESDDSNEVLETAATKIERTKDNPNAASAFVDGSRKPKFTQQPQPGRKAAREDAGYRIGKSVPFINGPFGRGRTRMMD